MEEKFSIESPMAPRWLMYPYIPSGSIGWRMGRGESYSMELCRWLNTLSEEENKIYKKMFPEPKAWRGFYVEYKEYWTYFWEEEGLPKYDLKSLIYDYNNGKNLDYIFFWGHQPNKNGKITKSCFSQWWMSEFSIGLDKYCCMEQYMMAEKARLFGDKEIKKEIMECKDPKEIKRLGRKVRNFDEEIWNDVKHSIVLNGNYNKFIQNDDLREFLISTGDKILVEASPYDNIWGIGMSADNENINNPLSWKGQNLLGFALMEVRDELIRVCENYKKLNFQELHKKFG
ncbi:NADAR family protein [Tepidibacter aestuarii]|uniref:NADAR family protein n=1 Tax=Tepidibacter aestuarii TaxID=2925782 RepID=UPI0020BFE559|nr:NADAR family protein [Tepidibacter aestuarii]CAH2213487.1 Riboflavin biosynthesis intermediates N-glycosidase (modular protein) [Tepidibacter aestuarii]